jgi:hypothetical protein
MTETAWVMRALHALALAHPRHPDLLRLTVPSPGMIAISILAGSASIGARAERLHAGTRCRAAAGDMSRTDEHRSLRVRDDCARDAPEQR